MLREISLLKAIRHSNIVQLYEIVETKDQLYLIMEYASHGELFDYIVLHKRVDELTALKFFRQIISGVAYLHSQNIIHRDLKPENLLLDSKDNIKIVDFGLSNRALGNNMLKTACGSPCYAPPEMLLGKKYKGPPADIWSCGVVLYALLCGHLPFDNPNNSRLFEKITNADFAVPNYVSKSAKDLIGRMLKVEPSARCTIEDVNKHPWFNNGEKSIYKLVQGITEVPVSKETLVTMKDKNIIEDTEKTAEYLKDNRHNYATTTYYLLMGGSKIVNGNLNPENIKDPDETFLFEETDFYTSKMYPGKKLGTLMKSSTARKFGSKKSISKKSTAFKDYNRNQQLNISHKKQSSLKPRNIITHRNATNLVVSTSQAFSSNLDDIHGIYNNSPNNMKYMNLTMTETAVKTIIQSGCLSTTDRIVSKSFKEPTVVKIPGKFSINGTPKINTPKDFKMKFTETEIRPKTTCKKYNKRNIEIKCYYFI